MSANAESVMRRYCSDEAVRDRLRGIMDKVIEAAARRPATTDSPTAAPAARVAEPETT
jgi:hypothetical protein